MKFVKLQISNVQQELPPKFFFRHVFVLSFKLFLLLQEKTSKLYTGDFYITRHSNLSEVHTVFHLVSDDSVRGDISSRHPVILSIRNIIKQCFRYDIHTLTIPLLLTHEMTEVILLQILSPVIKLLIQIICYVIVHA